MISLRQHVPFAVLLAAALAILGATFLLARQSKTVRVERSREPLHQFGAELQHELHRLERTYEGHLTRLARTTISGDRQAIWLACNQVIGVRQFSLVHRARERSLDLHVPVDVRPLPQPSFAEEQTRLPGAHLFLSEKDLLQGEETSGWLDAPGQPLVFWQRRAPDECVVLLIDSAAVAAAIESWLAPWVETGFTSVRAIGGPDRLSSPDNSLLAAAGEPGTAQADLLLPVRTRFGTWELASWDRRETRVDYRRGVLVTGGVAALLLLSLGSLLAGQQRRALLLAEQRVSFVNAVSHELRAPLTNILLNVELVAEVTEPDGVAGKRLRFVQEESRRLARLIENVLTFSRGNRAPRPVAARACSPAGVVRAAVSQFLPAFERRGLTLSVREEVNECCLLDPDALMQILANLLSNVEKHVPSGGAEISLIREQDILCVRVSDTGPGIPFGEAERIFEPFARLNSRTDATASGTGLGLAISRDLARAMGGTLSVEPSAAGAAFVLRLPWIPAPATALVAA